MLQFMVSITHLIDNRVGHAETHTCIVTPPPQVLNLLTGADPGGAWGTAAPPPPLPVDDVCL